MPIDRFSTKRLFSPIRLEDYIEMHLKENPLANREAVTKALVDTLAAYKQGAGCIICGKPIWVIGSAFGARMCFTCITGEALPTDDYEIDEACR